MKSKVIIVGRTVLSSFMDGRTRYYLDLVKSMSTLEQKRGTVNINYFPIYVIENRPRFLIFLLEQFLMFMYSLKLILLRGGRLIIHLAYPELLWYIMLPKGIKIVTFHDLYSYKNFREGGLKHRLWNLYASICYSLCRFLCHYFLAVSEETKRKIVSRLRIENYKVIVVPPGICHLNYYLEANRKSKSVGFIARCEAKKDPDFFVGVIRELSMLDDGWDVYLIGKDCKRIFLKLKNNINNINIKLHYSDYVSQDMLKKIYRTLFCLVHPSQQEGFGLTIVEALLNQVYVIIKKEAEIPQTVKQFCVKVGSPREAARIIISLWREYEMSQNESSNRYLQVMMLKKRFSWDMISRRLSALYNHLA